MSKVTEAGLQRAAFGGETFDEGRDGSRLQAQLSKVREAMLNGEWWGLRELAAAVGAPEASVSARLRDLRKPFGGEYIITRKYVSKGLWHYRLAGKVVRSHVQLSLL